MPRSFFILQLLLCASLARAHGGHEAHGENGEAAWQYAQRHMATEHHIDSYDPKSFFQLHDLNRDGILDREEIEAIYGVHHVYSQKKSKDETQHQQKADHIVNAVLQIMDKNKDGKITMEEFVASGDSALPNFEALGAEGHHYDVESEFFLHHEEMYHNTPETQTDEAYNHPEDIEHFAQHEQIERDEAEREAKFQGITVDEALAQHDHFEPIPGDAAPGDAAHADDSDKVAQPVEGGAGDEHVANPYFHDDAAVAADVHPHDDQMHAQQPIQNPPQPSNPKVNRVTPPEKQDPSTRYKDAKRESEVHDDWGTGSGGYKVPKSPSERMRKNVPYKYKFRRNWGDF